MRLDDTTFSRLLNLGYSSPEDFLMSCDENGLALVWVSPDPIPSDEVIASAATYYPVTSVTAAQALVALDNVGLYDIVEAAVTAHPVRAVKIWYNRALNWDRSNPYLNALQLEVGLTDRQVADLFYAASLL